MSGGQFLMGPHWGLTSPNFKLQIGAEEILMKERDVMCLGWCACSQEEIDYGHLTSTGILLRSEVFITFCPYHIVR